MKNCYFVSMSPTGRERKSHGSSFRDAVDAAKAEAQRSGASRDVNLVCEGQDIFLVTCLGKGKTCDTRFSGRPHGGLGRRRKR